MTPSPDPVSSAHGASPSTNGHAASGVAADAPKRRRPVRWWLYAAEIAVLAALTWFLVLREGAPLRGSLPQRAEREQPAVAARTPQAASGKPAAGGQQPAAGGQPPTVGGQPPPGGEAPPPAAAPLPRVAPAAQEIDGTWNGQPFWARLTAANPIEPGRSVQLVYTPPTAEALGGTVLHDCPFLTVDDQLRVLIWDDRIELGVSSVRRAIAKDGGYLVERELKAAGDALNPSQKLKVGADPAWDVRLAPVLLALCWTPGSAAEVRALDFFGPRLKEALTVSWTADGAVRIGGAAFTAVPDAGGRLGELRAEPGTVVLRVAGRK